ncbi:MAG: Uma2 family endonuclease [Pseudomonadota bacterium]
MVAELLRGRLHLQPRPASFHTRAASVLGVEIAGPFDRGRGGPGGWWILDEPELHLGDDVLVPDLAGWRRERMPQYPDVPAFTLVPDWVCEVLSPSTRQFDVTEKRARYLEAGVPHLWFVDPSARTLEVFEATDAGWLLVSARRDDEPVAEVPFDAVEFPLDALWAE